MTAATPAKLSPADRERGYEIGCDGWEKVADVADELKVDHKTIRRLIAAESLRAIKLDESRQGAVRVCRRSVREFIQARKL